MIEPNYPNMARSITLDHAQKKYPDLYEHQVHLVWFSKTLKNWKALTCTDSPNGEYYEITHNGETGETYVDEYTKTEQVVLKGNGHHV